MTNFIGIYDNACKPRACEQIIEYFEENKEKHIRGRYHVDGANRVDKTVKDSTDIHMHFSEKNVCNTIMENVLNFYTSQYQEKFRSTWIINNWSVDLNYNIQRYNPGQGYHLQHCEDYCPETNRVMAWTLYLNDVSDGGGTRFVEYDETVDAVAGRLCIFPAYWTHSHHGVVSPTQTKYIVTGWYIYNG